MASPKLTSIGTNLRRFRTERGLSQEQLAESAGVAAETISRIERGRLHPTVPLAERLAASLEVGLEGLTGKTKREPERKIRPAIARLVAVVRNLDDAAVDDVTRAVKILLGVARRAPARKTTSR